MIKPKTTKVLHLAGSILCAGAIGFAASASVQDGGAQDGAMASRIDAARAAQEQRAETLRLISKERAAWVTGRAILEDSIELVDQEIEGLRAATSESESLFTETREQVTELEAESERLAASLAVLDGTVAEAEERLKSLLERLPEPVLERVQPLTQRLPDDPSTTKLQLAERFGTVVAVVNEIDKFNREITTHSEIREVAEGPGVAVTALYVGIGQAYCANADRTLAWVGTVGDDGWVWLPHHEHAPAIGQAIDVAEGTAGAAFVALPTVIK